MAQCNDIGPTITPPAPTSNKDKVLEILGVEEVEITATVDGEEVQMIVLGRIEE